MKYLKDMLLFEAVEALEEQRWNELHTPEEDHNKEVAQMEELILGMYSRRGMGLPSRVRWSTTYRKGYWKGVLDAALQYIEEELYRVDVEEAILLQGERDD